MGEVVRMGSKLAPLAVALGNSALSLEQAASEEAFRLAKKFAPEFREVLMVGWQSLERDERGEFTVRSHSWGQLVLNDGRAIVHNEAGLKRLYDALKKVLEARHDDGGNDASSPLETSKSL
jgi:hypothetical protein